MECCRALFITDPEEDLHRLKRRKGGHVPGTCDWIMDTEQLNLWLGDSTQNTDRPSIFWLYGNPGVGKSTMTIAMAEILQSRPCFQGNERTLAYFFFFARPALTSTPQLHPYCAVSCISSFRNAQNRYDSS
jgi:hypothetical protein